MDLTHSPFQRRLSATREEDLIRMQLQAFAGAENVVVYDGECPFCSSYVKFAELKETMPDVRLLNARELPAELLDQIWQSYDLDEGMLFISGDNISWGSSAFSNLAVSSGRNSFLGKLNRIIFRNAWLSRLIYPILRNGRSATLYVLGRKRIRESKKAE